MKEMVLAARPWKRFVAFSLDIVVLHIIVLMPFSGWMQSSFPQGAGLKAAEDITGAQYAIIFIIFSFALLYFTLLDYLAGQSIGMMVFGLYTVEQDKKKVPGFFKCLLRNAAIMPVFPFVILWLLDPLFLLLKGSRLSDVALRSHVIEKVKYSQN